MVISVAAIESVAVVDGQGVQDGLPAADPPGEVVTSGPVLVGDKVLSARRSSAVARPSFWTSFFETVGRLVRRWGYEMPGDETLRVLVRLSEVFGSELVMKMS